MGRRRRTARAGGVPRWRAVAVHIHPFGPACPLASLPPLLTVEEPWSGLQHRGPVIQHGSRLVQRRRRCRGPGRSSHRGWGQTNRHGGTRDVLCILPWDRSAKTVSKRRGRPTSALPVARFVPDCRIPGPGWPQSRIAPSRAAWTAMPPRVHGHSVNLPPSPPGAMSPKSKPEYPPSKTRHVLMGRCCGSTQGMQMPFRRP